MININYVKGDATEPSIVKGQYSVICHCCNTLGAWGRGFVLPLAQKYPQAKKAYFDFIKKSNKKDALGQANIVKVKSNIIVANIMGQERIYVSADGKIPLDYDALKRGMTAVYDRMEQTNVPYTIHMPRIGCGLAGGEWNKVEDIIKEVFSEREISVTVYDFLTE